MIETACFLFFIIWIAIQDLRKREISLTVLLLFGIAGVVFHLIYGRLGIYDMLLGAAIGVVLLGISLLSGGRIGAGDGVLIIMTGLWAGFWNNLILLFISTALMGTVSLILIVLRKRGRRDEVPFAPYLFLTAILSGAMGGIDYGI